MEDSLNECSWWKLGRRLEELWVCYDHYKSSSFDNKVHVRVRGKYLIKKNSFNDFNFCVWCSIFNYILF
jgi:hypothetical protein